MPFTHHVITLLLVHIVPCAAAGGMMRRDKPPASGLRPALEKVLAGDPAQRLFVVEGILRPTFEAFPKNSAGKIAMQSLHTMARGYFAEEHGWLFKGFEFAGPRSTKLSDATLLRDKGKELARSLEEAESLGEGLSLSDTVAAVAAVEHLVLEESVALLHRSYTLNEVSLTGSAKRAVIEDVLQSYLLLFREGKRHNTTDPHEHQSHKAEFQMNGDWESLEKLRAFYKESVDSIGTPSEYALADASQIVKDMALRYGKWQNSECEEMKQVLLKLDSGGTGRVPLDVFHAQPHNPHFSFTESAEYLRKISSLDETRPGSPKVMIANYLASPSNCIAWSEYFSVCCLNECESLVNELEARVQTSDVPVQQLLDTVAELSSGTVVEPRELSPHLVKMAKSVAGVHGGVMPLQSGDFRRWFHFAYPNECPFPTDVEAEVAEDERDATERWLGGQESGQEASEAGVSTDDL